MFSKQMCADNCKGEENCANACFTGKECGASNPTRVNTTSTRTSTHSATGSGTATGTDGNSSPTTDPFNTGNMGARVASWGSVYGVGVMVAGMAVGFIGFL